MKVITQSNVVEEYKKSLYRISCSDLVPFLIDVLLYMKKNLAGTFDERLLFFEAFDENYFGNLKSTDKHIPPFVIISVVKDEPATVGGSGFSTGPKMVVPRNVPDGDIVTTDDGEKAFSVMFQDRDVLVTFKCFDITDNAAYKLCKKIEQVLTSIRKLFGKYGINTSFTYGVSSSFSGSENIDKITQMSHRELLWYFRIQEISLESIDAIISGYQFDDLYSKDELQDSVVITAALTGDATGSTSFDGSDNVTITTAVADNIHTHLSQDITDATDANIASMIVKRDGSGNFSAGTITLH